ncbi:hypothetical protein [Arcobacter arenosus]|jgi:hypothetical protein|uniref:hypothetical protein n=1 Tax=Arcobacter arenosus TaxID=2576037 RepID=UPI003BABA4BA
MKRNYWPLFFIGIFSFVFAMIVWTIMSASKVPVNKDETFLTSYQDVDNNYNKIVHSNENFENKYDFKLSVNGKQFGLVYKDMFLAQRVIEKVSKHKDIFNFGTKNEVNITVSDKKTGKNIENFDVKLRISRPTNHDATMDFNEKQFKVDLPLKGNWNITGQVKVADDIGYFYIKSNAR